MRTCPRFPGKCPCQVNFPAGCSAAANRLKFDEIGALLLFRSVES